MQNFHHVIGNLKKIVYAQVIGRMKYANKGL